MLKEHATLFRRLSILVDLCIVGIAFIIGFIIRNNIEGIKPIREYIWILPVLLTIWGCLLYFQGMYASFRLKRTGEVLSIILSAAFLGFIIFASLFYFFRLEHISRLFVFIVFFSATLFISIEKIILVQFFRQIRKRGFNFKNMMVVGTGIRANRFIQNVDKHKEFGLNIIGLIDEDVKRVGKQIAGHKVIGTLEELPEILRAKAIDHVVFIVPRASLSKIEEPILYCETLGVAVSVAVDLFELQLATGKEGSMLGLPMITFETVTGKLWHLLIKRVMDVILSGSALLLLSPVFIFIFIGIKFSSKGPAFFRQTRCSLNGREFLLYKFRTMVEDAEEQLDDLRRYNEMEGPVFKMEKDPRVTNIGAFLRKTSLDEIPQFWNVLKGDMSLVGPRPPLPEEVEKYDHWQRRRLSMRPGITCLWQAGGRNKITDFNQWMKLDLEYIDN